MRPLAPGYSLVAVLLVACTLKPSTDHDATAGDEHDYVGKDAQVGLGTLRFSSDVEQHRFMRARACLAERGASWEHYPLRQIGNFVEEDWCRGEGATRGCAGGGFREQDDVDWATVGTLHYPQSWPEVFGVEINLGRSRPGSGWDAHLWIATNGKSIVGDGLHVDFRTDDDWVHLGSSYTHEIGDNQYLVKVEEDPWVILERLRSNPQALLEGVERWRELERQVIEALEGDEVLECIYGEYQGDGIPPACEQRVPLDATEKAARLQEIRSKVARIVELLENEGGAMHAALLELAPTDCIGEGPEAPSR